MPAQWESETPDEEWSDREAWRGDEHADDVDGWRHDDSESSVWEEEEDAIGEPDTWAGWPEDLAGPEYWMYKDFEE
jgi:hypothetical protein